MRKKVYSIENQDGLNFVYKRHHRAPTQQGKGKVTRTSYLFFFGEIDPDQI